MKFIDMLRCHDRSKTALITESGVYTYGELIGAAESAEDGKGLRIIYGRNAFDELTRFLGAVNSVPVIAGAEAELLTECPAADFAVTSSGSTGVPKLIFRTTESWYNFFGEQNRVFGITAESRLFMNGSLCFSGNLNIILGALFAGAAVIITKDRLTRTRMADIGRYCADAVYLIPDKLKMLCRYYEGGTRTVKTVIAGSQSMGRDEALRLSELLGAERVILYYGASEVSYVSYLDILAEDKPRSCIGKPFNGIKAECGGGFLSVSSPYAALGTEKPFVMGDIISADSNGYLYFNGRHDDVINIGGEKLSASALENEIRSVRGITDACVYAKTGENGRVSLCCAYCGDADVSEIIKSAALSHMPKKWYRLSELPKNASGKTDRHRL